MLLNVTEERGKWSSPGGGSRKFASSLSDLSITRYCGKQRTLIFQGNVGFNLKEFLIDVCENTASSGCVLDSVARDDVCLSFVTACGGKVLNNIDECEPAAVFGVENLSNMANVLSENFEEGMSFPSLGSSFGKTNSTSGLVTGTADPSAERARCSCSYGCVLVELEEIKFHVEVLQSRTDFLQSLTNAQKVCFSVSEYSYEISRLNRQLCDERKKKQISLN